MRAYNKALAQVLSYPTAKAAYPAMQKLAKKYDIPLPPGDGTKRSAYLAYEVMFHKLRLADTAATVGIEESLKAVSRSWLKRNGYQEEIQYNGGERRGL